MTSVAFVCVGNAGRSQMAAAFARALGPPGLTVLSGGTKPAAKVNETVVEAMREKGIDLRGAVPRKLTLVEAAGADFFVTMGCSLDEACPSGYRGDARAWQLDDPKGKSLDEVRAIRDATEGAVRGLLAEIAAKTKTAASR